MSSITIVEATFYQPGTTTSFQLGQKSKLDVVGRILFKKDCRTRSLRTKHSAPDNKDSHVNAEESSKLTMERSNKETQRQRVAYSSYRSMAFLSPGPIEDPLDGFHREETTNVAVPEHLKSCVSELKKEDYSANSSDTTQRQSNKSHSIFKPFCSHASSSDEFSVSSVSFKSVASNSVGFIDFNYFSRCCYLEEFSKEAMLLIRKSCFEIEAPYSSPTSYTPSLLDFQRRQKNITRNKRREKYKNWTITIDWPFLGYSDWLKKKKTIFPLGLVHKLWQLISCTWMKLFMSHRQW